MKVLVTGVDGYIGSVLAPILTREGHTVVGLDTGFYREGWLYNDRAHFTQLPTTINKDIREITADDLDGIDAIVHLAELSNDPLGENKGRFAVTGDAARPLLLRFRTATKLVPIEGGARGVVGASSVAVRRVDAGGRADAIRQLDGQGLNGMSAGQGDQTSLQAADAGFPVGINGYVADLARHT